MATKKKHEEFTKDETLLLLASVGLCVAKAFIEAEVPVIGRGVLALGLGAAVNLKALMENVETNGTAPRLRMAVDKAKRRASARLNGLVQ